MKYQHIFGPVPSRRLGISLGVDLVYHKVCNLDCVYCECGKFPDPDAITFSGSGEPTLHKGIGQVIRFIKGRKPRVRVVVLTNSTLLQDSDVRKDLLDADVVMPSLDAVFQNSFFRINRPHKGLDCDGMVKGLTAFSREFAGELNLEIFIVPGVNDSKEELLSFQRVRPGTVDHIVPATREELMRVVQILDRENIQIIAKVKDDLTAKEPKEQGSFSAGQLRDMILETIHRRPCTAKDLAMTLHQDQGLMERELSTLLKKGVIRSRVSPCDVCRIRLRVLLPPFLRSGCLASGILLVVRKSAK